MKPELEKLLEKVVQGVPGSYQKFLDERRSLKGGCSDLEFITYISEQKDISHLEPEVYAELRSLEYRMARAKLLSPLEPKLVPLLKAVIANSKVNAIQSLGAFCLLSTSDLILQHSHTTPDERIQWFEKCHAIALNPQEKSASLVKNCLAFMYLNGIGIKKDAEEAVKWYRRAAEQGLIIAQCNLGTMYTNGRGVEKNYTEALKWFRLAADHEFADAQFNLGVVYANGRGVEKNYTAAEKWFRLAAEQGFAFAQCNLGMMYANGCGVEKNISEAVKWYRLAAEQGHPEALKQCDIWATSSALIAALQKENADLKQENLNLRHHLRQLGEAQVQRPILNPETTMVMPAPLKPPTSLPFSPVAVPSATSIFTSGPVLSLPSTKSGASAFATTSALNQAIEQGGVACYASPLNTAGSGPRVPIKQEQLGQKRNANPTDAADEGNQLKRHAGSSNNGATPTPTNRR